MGPCARAMHVPIAASRPTNFTPERHGLQAVAHRQNSQAAANINLQDWHPQYSANSTSLQGRWPQDPTGPRYRTSSFVDEPLLQQTGANLEVYRGLEPAPMEAGQPIPVAPDMLDVQVANNGLHNWQTWRRPVHPTVTPAQTFWSQDTIGEWYPHPKYEEEVPIHRASANFGPPPAAYQDFGGPATDPTIPYNSNTYQVCPTRKPVATVDEGSVTDSNVSPHEYWLWLVGGTSVECVEERRE
ncbi:hypothetical protein C2E23DRAFT_806914 [Lenzites betulinus]|nr:hypothetical protein C2E23DRAFT_806914 [Lenzites betulinus]